MSANERTRQIQLIGDIDECPTELLVHLIQGLGDNHQTVEQPLQVAFQKMDPKTLECLAASIFSCRYFGRFELDAVLRLATNTEQRPILIVAKQIALECYRKIDLLQNTVALQVPFHTEIFTTLLGRICAGREFKPKISSRFVTNEEVRVLSLETGLMINSRMRNYSSGGVFIEYRGISLKVGERVQISMASQLALEEESHLHLQAKVVRERKIDDNPQSPARGVGLQFVA